MAQNTDRSPLEMLAEPTLATDEPRPRHLPSRTQCFLSVFVTAAVAGLLFTFLRTPIYRSSATLLVEPPTGNVPTAGAASGVSPASMMPAAGATQYLATERQRLLSEPVLTLVANEFATTLGGHPPLGTLQGMVDVTYVAETNLIEIGIEGPTPDVLPRILEHWLEEYTTVRTTATSSAHEDASADLKGQLAALETRIAEQRARVDAFRVEHDIVSPERAENRDLAKLTGLNESINRAEEDETKARARFDAVRQAIAAGEPVTQDRDRVAIEQLEEKMRVLRDQVQAYAGQFTEKFAQIAPEITAARKNLKMVEADLAAKRTEATAAVLAQTEHDLKAALAGQQSALKSKLTNFGQHFEAFKTLEQRLTELQAQAAPLRERVVKSDVAAHELFAAITVLAKPSTPTRPVRPAYARDAGIAVGSAFALALLATLLIDFLARTPMTVDAPEPPSTVYTYNTHLLSPLPAATQPLLNQRASLPTPSVAGRRELMPAEVNALLAAADDQSRLIVALLLAGAAPEDIAMLTAGDIGPNGHLRLAGRTEDLSLPVNCLVLLAHRGAAAPGPDMPLFQQPGSAPLASADLDATLTYLAHDAGVSRPDEVSVAALRHTYFAYLVRQGLRLGELPRVGGALAPVLLASYAPYAPPGVGRRLEEIDAVYPALHALG
ncbi:MAG: hypothetical protein HYX63_17745 [Gammaproteobacteria bacterium]|nr:hypothetical protein [Gammaproteobacteria bacterium]